MWTIFEHRELMKICQRLPRRVLIKYELWKEYVEEKGPRALRNFPGFRDEALRGKLSGWRSSRLSILHRLLYQVDTRNKEVFVRKIVPHKYSGTH